MAMRFRSRFPFKTIALVGVAVIITGGIALATSASGVTPGPLTRATFADDVAIKFKFEIPGGTKEVANLRDPSQVVTQEITFDPNGHTGWHSHPGPVIVQVRSGTLTYYAGDDRTCTGHEYSAGDAFMDPGRGHVHIARNESATEPLTIVAVYFDVPAGASPRIDVSPAPGNCPF
jgi:quercetin dioxygenase-like cupin family protein